MKNIVLELSTEEKYKIYGKPVYRTRLCVKSGSIPALLWAQIVGALDDWMKFEEGNPKNRFEIFR